MPQIYWLFLLSHSCSHIVSPLLFFIFPFWLVYMMPNLRFDPLNCPFDGMLCYLIDSVNIDESEEKHLAYFKSDKIGIKR